MKGYKKSRFVHAHSVPHDSGNLLALHHNLTGAFILAPADQWYELEYSTSEPPKALIRNGFFIPAHVDETVVFDIWRQQYVHDFSTLLTKMMITRRCNNRCTYCNIQTETGEMSRETAETADRFHARLIEEKQPRRVKDDYLGGEPLLNPEVMLQSVRRRHDFCRSRHIDYSFTFTTNGRLLVPELIEQLIPAGLSHIRVSLAGPEPFHDALRPSAQGGKTYRRIIHNLKAISHKAPLLIECQYDAAAQDYKTFCKWMDELKSYDLNIREIYFNPIMSARHQNLFDGGAGDPQIFLFLRKQAGLRGLSANDRMTSNDCMADLRSRMVIDVDGSIIACPALQSGEFVYGNVDDGIDFVLESHILTRRLPEKCRLECELLPLCLGGCRQQALTRQNDFFGIDCQYDVLRQVLENFMEEKACQAMNLQKGV